MLFAVRSRLEGVTTTVTVTGEIDLASVVSLRRELRAAQGHVRVDLADVDVIDSVGIGLLIGAARRTRDRGDTFAVVAAPDHVDSLLRRCGVHEVLAGGSDTVAPGAEPSARRGVGT